MNHLKNTAVAITLSLLVTSCFSGSSTQSSSTERKAPKRLGESSSSSTPAPSNTQSSSTTNNAPKASTTATDAQQGQTMRTLYVNVASANVRSMPSKDATIISKLKFLDPVGATGVLDGEWVQVEITMTDGALGKAWIHSTLVSASKEQAEAVKAAGGN